MSAAGVSAACVMLSVTLHGALAQQLLTGIEAYARTKVNLELLLHQTCL